MTSAREIGQRARELLAAEHGRYGGEAYLATVIHVSVDSALRAIEAALRSTGGEVSLDRYDAGLLGNGGGGDVDWWQDYIRAELERAHEFYRDQVTPPPVSDTGERG